jgi:hypothetical protein
VLHLAGHGTALNGEYYFLTQELDNDSEAAIRRQALSGNELRELLRPIQASGGPLLLLDTCSSGTYGSPAQRDLQAAVRRFEELDGRLCWRPPAIAGWPWKAPSKGAASSRRW